MAGIPDWKRQSLAKRVQDWSYGTLIDQLEEIYYLEALMLNEIDIRNKTVAEEDRRLVAGGVRTPDEE